MNLKKQERWNDIEKEMIENRKQYTNAGEELRKLNDKFAEIEQEQCDIQNELSTQCTTDNCENKQDPGDDFCKEHLEEAISEEERKSDRKTRTL